MGLFEQWTNMTSSAAAQTSGAFWKDYDNLETHFYEVLLDEAKETTEHKGTVADLAAHYEVDPVPFTGILSGINESLKEPVDLADLEADSEIAFDVDLEELYRNMLNAKAEHLYTLSEWDPLYSEDERREIRRDWLEKRTAHTAHSVGRNDPCPCGSGKKYKNCCWKKDHEQREA